MDYFWRIEFDSRCKRLTAAIGAAAAVLLIAAAVSWTSGSYSAVMLAEFFGELAACAMLTLFSDMAAGAAAKVSPARTRGICYAVAEALAEAVKIFFVMTPANAEEMPFCVAALVIDTLAAKYFLYKSAKRLAGEKAEIVKIRS